MLDQSYDLAAAIDEDEIIEEGFVLMMEELWTKTPNAGTCVICLRPTISYPSTCNACLQLDNSTFNILLNVATLDVPADQAEQFKLQRKAAIIARRDYAC
ncbi:hypothetical protein [Dietzia cinnamea]|uniref:hypothetical protein n=1 Tax=Dietzia cinnamea TaxID=321318 RepID=UPI00223B70D7|nr:hypothetical protein [Dietzia cinnamea]MCT2077435.1 hypothetical protein [Dietzia cinnamea]MCT2221294.1 hypothetical protein [Dietzia cinnamea]